MVVRNVFEPESAADFWQQMVAAYELEDAQQMYLEFGKIFGHFLHQHTARSTVKLVGAFAQTEFLLREHEVQPSLCKAVNEARIRFRKAGSGELSVEILRENAPYDFKAICLFIEQVEGTSVPPEVERLFPTNRPQRTLKVPEAEYLRVLVSKVDNDNIYGQIEAEPLEVVICYSHGNTVYNFDWTYLRQQLHGGSQINIIRPRLYDGILYPELIIVEPDYLVDISAIAACFENYAHSSICSIRFAQRNLQKLSCSVTWRGSCSMKKSTAREKDNHTPKACSNFSKATPSTSLLPMYRLNSMRTLSSRSAIFIKLSKTICRNS